MAVTVTGRRPRSLERIGRARSAGRPLGSAAREEQAITEFGALLGAHPFDASLPGVAYPEVADHSLALDAYDRAKDAPAGEVRSARRASRPPAH
ncbi:hypothetical protein ACN6LL_007841, partial [Streptomyces violaceoruber]